MMNDDTKQIIAAHRSDSHKAPTHRVQQWHFAIDEAAALERGRATARKPRWRPGTFLWSAAITASLAVGIGIGLVMPGNERAVEAPAASSVAFSRGLQYHLRDSQVRLASFASEPNTADLVLDIVEQNRLFEAAAEMNNAPQVARLLRAFEPILLQLAADDIGAEDADALREQLEFELNVMLTKLARESSEETHST